MKDVIENWYESGCSTRQHSDAPGDDGIFGGTFHFLSDIESVENGYRFGVDFGSANKRDAISDLKTKVEELGYKISFKSDKYDWIYVTKAE